MESAYEFPALSFSEPPDVAAVAASVVARNRDDTHRHRHRKSLHPLLPRAYLFN